MEQKSRYEKHRLWNEELDASSSLFTPGKMEKTEKQKESGGESNSECNKSQTDSASSQNSTENSSKEQKCPICLGPLTDKSKTDSCPHLFCFTCIEQWSAIKPECPLCKTVFTSIFHNIRSPTPSDTHQPTESDSHDTDQNIRQQRYYVSTCGTGVNNSHSGLTEAFGDSDEVAPLFQRHVTYFNIVGTNQTDVLTAGLVVRGQERMHDPSLVRRSCENEIRHLICDGIASATSPGPVSDLRANPVCGRSQNG